MDTIDAKTKHQIVNITNTARQLGKSTTFNFLPDVMLDAVDILFAPGHVALTGVRINYGGVTILPWNQATSFIAGDNERLRFDIGMFISGPLTIITDNNDTYPHGFQLTWYYHEYQVDPGLTSLPPVPLVAL